VGYNNFLSGRFFFFWLRKMNLKLRPDLIRILKLVTKLEPRLVGSRPGGSVTAGRVSIRWVSPSPSSKKNLQAYSSWRMWVSSI